MEKIENRHMDERLNIRSFYLRLIRKIWILPLSALIGALAGALIYTLVTDTFGPLKTYSADTELYIDFARDDTGEVVDHYNAYTWKNQLMPSDEVMDVLLDELSKAGHSDISKDEVLASATAEIPSDVRIIVVTAKSTDKDRADAINKAAAASLISYGNTNDAFDSITVISQNDAKLVVYSDRTVVAAVFGAIVLLIASILLLMLKDALDDAIYVPEECENRYKLPVLGVLFKDGEAHEFFDNETKALYEKVLDGASDILFISVDSIDDASKSEEDLESLKKALGNRFADSAAALSPISVPGNVLDNYRKIGTTDGVVLAIPYGKKNIEMAEHTIAQLSKHDCKIFGIYLVRSDLRFMKQYYGLK